MDKEIVIHKHTLKCFSAIKKMEILPFGTTQTDLNSIMLSEVSQRKTNTVWSHLYMKSKKKKMQRKKPKLIEKEIRFVATKADSEVREETGRHGQKV